MTLKDWELKRMDLYVAVYASAIGDRHSYRHPHDVANQALKDFEILFPRPVRSFMVEGDEGVKL